VFPKSAKGRLSVRVASLSRENEASQGGCPVVDPFAGHLIEIMPSFSRHALALVAALLFSGVPGHAGGNWFETEGAKVRVVTAGLPQADCKLHGEPGWKTYWRNPGDAGVPPSVSIAPPTALVEPEIHFPAPELVVDTYGSWAGYHGAVALPLVFDVGDREDPFEVDVFLGVCESICIPVQARFTVDPAPLASDRDAAQIVHAAFAELPEPAHDHVHARIVGKDDDHLLVEAVLPGAEEDAAEPQLFVASDGGLTVGTAKPVLHEDWRTMFEVPVLGKPKPGRSQLFYTLSSGDEAVDGRLDVAY
jgi:DsbC/DsbD-like thiol-disulfide interchange protein